MDISLITVLADAMKDYYDSEELVELCESFNIKYEFDHQARLATMNLARNLIEKSEQGNNRLFLKTIVPSLAGRASKGVASTSWERRDYHEEMSSNIRKLVEALQVGAISTEISVPEESPFMAKSEIREFLDSAETPILIVDNYVGAGTLDCFRDVQHPIRLLTGQHSGSIESGFERVLKEFRSEGHSIEIRQHPRLHDRHLLFNDRCWIVGSSLKDAGKKKFNVVECVDSKESIVADINAKWDEATEYK